MYLILLTNKICQVRDDVNEFFSIRLFWGWVYLSLKKGEKFARSSIKSFKASPLKCQSTSEQYSAPVYLQNILKRRSFKAVALMKLKTRLLSGPLAEPLTSMHADIESISQRWRVVLLSSPKQKNYMCCKAPQTLDMCTEYQRFACQRRFSLFRRCWHPFYFPKRAAK